MLVVTLTRWNPCEKIFSTDFWKFGELLENVFERERGDLKDKWSNFTKNLMIFGLPTPRHRGGLKPV